ncbi:hypothetical protein AK812_SmicGene23267 [Symbiodinium microadriaticum]|uniref:Uncharacterized protein n=1 Tax=Symbiodinium microadriaticum TaxID=2951 RepID=A0A1Q9DHM9_SYMMI|nr:hypothetical protein AK812_SmicGene23267 [Symbiodinium microadriaticum]
MDAISPRMSIRAVSQPASLRRLFSELRKQGRHLPKTPSPRMAAEVQKEASSFPSLASLWPFASDAGKAAEETPQERPETRNAAEPAEAAAEPSKPSTAQLGQHRASASLRPPSGSDDAEAAGSLPLPTSRSLRESAISSTPQGSPSSRRARTGRESSGEPGSPGARFSADAFQSDGPGGQGEDRQAAAENSDSKVPALTAFAEQLASATQRAPQRLAERLTEQLQQSCLEEAAMGQSSFTWDMQLPSNSRTFMHQVARAFASRVEALGFEQVEWWNGREWSKQSRQYHIVHDPVYEKYHMKIKVRWLERLPQEEDASAPRRQITPQPGFTAPSAEQAVVEQVSHWLDMQRQMLEQQLGIHAADDNQESRECLKVKSCAWHPKYDFHSLRILFGDRFHSAFRVGASGNFQIRTMGPGPFPYRMESCKELR